MLTFASAKLKQLAPWLIGLSVIITLALLAIPLSQVELNVLILRQWIEPLGPFAPLAYFGLNIAQIVVAPLPGYPVQILGGVLFGPFIGSITAVGGMVVGGVLAAWLGRYFGRSWLEARLGSQTFERWSNMAYIHSFWTWWLILLIPLGDIPYFLAGLSRLPLRWFALAILLSRGPFTILIVWFGDQATELPLGWFVGFMVVIGLIVLGGYSQRERLERWGEQYLHQQTENRDTQE